MWLLRSMLDPLAFRYCMTSSWLALKQPSKNERTPSSPLWHSWQMAFVNSSSSAICKCQNIISNVIIVGKAYFLANFYFICKVKYILASIWIEFNCIQANLHNRVLINNYSRNVAKYIWLVLLLQHNIDLLQTKFVIMYIFLLKVEFIQAHRKRLFLYVSANNVFLKSIYSWFKREKSSKVLIQILQFIGVKEVDKIKCKRLDDYIKKCERF